jgi:glycine cleavage system aminomethyltransferase T
LKGRTIVFLSVSDQSLDRSPYFNAAHKAGAQSYIVLNHMFMPYRYGDPVEEYWALVNDVTLWDVATERQVEIGGPDAERFVDILVPRNLDRFGVGQCRYVVLTDQCGHILNDPVLNRLEKNRYWLSTADSDLLLWAKGVAVYAGLDVSINQPDVAPIQIQGGKSRDVMASLFGDVARELRYYRLAEAELDGMPVVISRTGWSGDLGYEVYLCDTGRADELWGRVMEAGKPFNIRVTGPNTIRRVEAGIVAMRSDFPADATPLHLGMERLVDLDKKPDFIGKQALGRIAGEGVAWKLVGIAFDPEALAGEAAAFARRPLLRAGKEIGATTVVVHSPRLQSAIGYARLDSRFAALGTELEIEGPKGVRKAKVVETPFFDSRKSIARQ